MIVPGIPALLAALVLGALDGPATLEEQLSREGAAALTRAAVSQGDARRGSDRFLSTPSVVRVMPCQGRAR